MPIRVVKDWRKKGGKKPVDVIDCTRPGKYGNSYVVRPMSQQSLYYSCLTTKEAVTRFRRELQSIMKEPGTYMHTSGGLHDICREDILALKDVPKLACYCKLGDECHVDAIIEVLDIEDRAKSECA